MRTLSSNGFSFEDQVRDVLSYCKHHLPELWHDVMWRANDEDWADPEWYMILCDRLESDGPFRWWEGEPFVIDVDEYGYCVDVDWLNVVWDGDIPQWLLAELAEAGYVTAGF